MKHLYKKTTNQIWLFLAGFKFLLPLWMLYKQERFAGIKICNFVCLSAILENQKCSQWLLILNIPILKSGVMQVVLINECKSHEICNNCFFNVIFSFSKTKDKLVMIQILQLLSGTILHDTSNESETYLEPIQTSMRELLCKNS